MNVRSALSVAAIISAMALPTTVFAQEEHVIGGQMVPADQVSEVQAKCDELRAPAVGADAAASDAAAPEASANGDASADVWLEDGTIDLTKLTVALCEEGNFVSTSQ